MKKVILLLLSGVLFGGTCLAQNGYTISGKIRGLSVTKVFVVTADFGQVDTLASTLVERDKFILRGTVPRGSSCRELDVCRGGRTGTPVVGEYKLSSFCYCTRGCNRG